MNKKLHLILTGILFPVIMNAQTSFNPVGNLNLQQQSKQSMLKSNPPQDLPLYRQSSMSGVSKNNPSPVLFPFSVSGFYREDFEGAAFPPAGWQVVDVLNPAYSWLLSTNFPKYGSQSAGIPYDALPGEDWLILPKFTVTATDSFSFNIAMYQVGNAPDSTFILVSTTDSALTSFTTVVATLAEGLNYPTATYDYTYFSYSLSAFAGSDIYVAIKNMNTNGDGYFLDRVEIGSKPAVNAVLVSIDLDEFLPTGTTYSPTATVLNDGYTTATFPVTMNITGGYTSVKNVTNLAPGASQVITFDPWITPAVPGNETVSVQTQLVGDLSPSDDSSGFAIRFLEPFNNYGWSSKALISPEKWGLPLASINTNDTSYLFTMGGNVGVNFTDSARMYLPYADSWVDIPNMPVAGAYASGASYNNKVYVVGGFVSYPNVTNANRIYDMTSNSWSLGTPIPTLKYYYTIGVYHDSLFYYIGGDNTVTALTSVNIYNAASGTWSVGTNLPSPTAGAGGGISGNKIVVSHGTDGTFLGTIDPANPNNISWTVGDDYPVDICWGLGGAASLDESSGLIVFTGGALNSSLPLECSKYTFAYDVNSDQWKLGPPKPTAVGNMSNLTAVVNNDSLYIVSVGGWSGSNPVKVNEWLNMGPYVIPAGVADNNPVNSSFICYPNPFINVTDIKFSLSQPSAVKAVITDLLGQEVEVLCNKNMQPGTQDLQWDAAKYESGIYFCRLTANGSQTTQKLVKY